MRVLVTGASGFVGAAIVQHLVEAGHAVRAAARRPDALTFNAPVEPVQLADLAGPFDAAALVEGVDAVVHAAGLAHQPRGVDEALLTRVNGGAAGELATAAAAAGVRIFILISSIRAITGPSSPVRLDEDAPPKPTDAYGRSKLAGEMAVRNAFPDAIVLRPPGVHGTRAHGNMRRLAALARSGLPLPLGGLMGWHSIVSDRNLASAVAHLLQDAGAAGGTFHVDDGAPLSLAEMVEAMRAALGRRSLVLTAPRLMTALLRSPLAGARGRQILDGLTVSSERLRERGWRPVEPSAAGLARLARG